jgi:hypothetical protein
MLNEILIRRCFSLKDDDYKIHIEFPDGIKNIVEIKNEENNIKNSNKQKNNNNKKKKEISIIQILDLDNP